MLEGELFGEEAIRYWRSVKKCPFDKKHCCRVESCIDACQFVDGAEPDHLCRRAVVPKGVKLLPQDVVYGDDDDFDDEESDGLT